jgi:hypothetical protein
LEERNREQKLEKLQIRESPVQERSILESCIRQKAEYSLHQPYSQVNLSERRQNLRGLPRKADCILEENVGSSHNAGTPPGEEQFTRAIASVLALQRDLGELAQDLSDAQADFDLGDEYVMEEFGGDHPVPRPDPGPQQDDAAGEQRDRALSVHDLRRFRPGGCLAGYRDARAVADEGLRTGRRSHPWRAVAGRPHEGHRGRDSPRIGRERCGAQGTSFRRPAGDRSDLPPRRLLLHGERPRL